MQFIPRRVRCAKAVIANIQPIDELVTMGAGRLNNSFMQLPFLNILSALQRDRWYR